ncbi:MAG: class I SAM-dependent methyltransferase [Flavobacteriaceae bacterium]|nr:class I SAM-dependent methyltransferase [Flavobacteriaceae bacterium]
MYQIISYLKHYFRSIKLHGVHSPFVFDLVTKCFNDNHVYPEYKLLEKYNLNLKESAEILTVKEFGAGSKVFRSNERKVSAISKHAGISLKRQQLLWRLSKYLDFQNTIELGTSLGKATYAFALNKKNTVTSIEGCPATAAFAEKKLRETGCQNLKIINDPFDHFLNTPIGFSPDCVFIDGNHNKNDTLSYFEKLLPRVHNDTVLIFDDIYWSKDMTEAWKEISSHPGVTVSIDTFYWGLAFFRKEQEKESFTIRM